MQTGKSRSGNVNQSTPADYDGSCTGYAINPARDLGPRIMTAMVGYGAQGQYICTIIDLAFLIEIYNDIYSCTTDSVHISSSLLDLGSYHWFVLRWPRRGSSL